MVVSFSGIDGAGKTTQINLLIKYCEEHNLKCTRKWSKARGTPGIMFLKKIIRRDKGLDNESKLDYRKKIYNTGWKKKLLLIFSLLDLCWYWGLYYRVIQHKYDVMILDRYIWDTFVEVSTEFGSECLKKSFLWKIVKIVALKPKKSILLMIPPEESLRRDLLKGEITTDELELKKEKVDYYLQLREKKSWNVEIDAMQSIDDTFNIILKEIGLKEKNNGV